MGNTLSGKLVLVPLAVLAVIGCGGGERSAGSGRLVVEKSLAGAPVFVEGSTSHLRVVDEDGTEIVAGLRPVATLDVPLVDRVVREGTYRLIAVERPCHGDCGQLDAPARGTRCELRVNVTAGRTTVVDIVLRGALGGVASDCSVRRTAAGAAALPPPQRERVYLGPAFEGLPLTASRVAAGDAFSFVYGRCKPQPGEGGCAAPLEVQNWSICTRHPLEIDRLPVRITRVRGVPVVDYGDDVEVLTGRATVVLFGDASLVHRAIRALRPVLGPAAPGARLPPPRLPRRALQELELVRELRARGVTRRELRRRLGISVSAVRMREQLAAAVGKRARSTVC